MGRDHTLFALKNGKVKFHKTRARTVVSIEASEAPVPSAAE